MAELNAAHASEGSALRAALEAETEDEARALAAEFLRLRQARYAALKARYAPDLISYERSVEWIEGPARFVELALIRRAPELDQDRLGPLGFQDPDSLWIEFLDQLAVQERFRAGSASDTRNGSRTGFCWTACPRVGRRVFWMTVCRLKMCSQRLPHPAGSRRRRPGQTGITSRGRRLRLKMPAYYVDLHKIRSQGETC